MTELRIERRTLRIDMLVATVVLVVMGLLMNWAAIEERWLLVIPPLAVVVALMVTMGRRVYRLEVRANGRLRLHTPLRTRTVTLSPDFDIRRVRLHPQLQRQHDVGEWVAEQLRGVPATHQP